MASEKALRKLKRETEKLFRKEKLNTVSKERLEALLEKLRRMEEE